jgi:hypothetical protein
MRNSEHCGAAVPLTPSQTVASPRFIYVQLSIKSAAVYECSVVNVMSKKSDSAQSKILATQKKRGPNMNGSRNAAISSCRSEL